MSRSWTIGIGRRTWALGACLLLPSSLLAQTSAGQSTNAASSAPTSSGTAMGTGNVAPGTSSASPAVGSPTASSAAKPGAPATIIQIKKEIQGDFSYRFVATTESGSAPAPLPAPAGTDNIVPIPLPSSLKVKGAELEVIDNGRGNVARLPVTTNGVTSLTEGSFKYVQTVFVPVQAKGLGAIGILVDLTSASKKYDKTWLLKANDNGIAQFQNVPLGEPVTVTVSYGSNAPISQTQTLALSHAADGYHWQAIGLDWTDVKTVPAPPPVPTPAPRSEASPAPTHNSEASQAERGGNGFANLLNSLLGLAMVGAIGYGLYWAYANGKLKPVFDKLGINTAPLSSAATPANPFAKPERTPITPITEGTADPFGGMSGVGAFAPAPPVSAGPRLIATAGSYSGQIFPINGSSADIGRDAGNPVPLPQDTNTSRRHATLANVGGQYTLTDNGSSNGTFVNGVRIASQTPTPLRPGDEVQVGMTRFRFEA